MAKFVFSGGHFEFWPKISEAELFFRGSGPEIIKYTITIKYTKYGTFCHRVTIKSLRPLTICVRAEDDIAVLSHQVKYLSAVFREVTGYLSHIV